MIHNKEQLDKIKALISEGLDDILKVHMEFHEFTAWAKGVKDTKPFDDRVAQVCDEMNINQTRRFLSEISMNMVTLKFPNLKKLEVIAKVTEAIEESIKLWIALAVWDKEFRTKGAEDGKTGTSTSPKQG